MDYALMITDVICGIPSVTVAAVVNANKLLVWEVTDGNWNGELSHRCSVALAAIFQVQVGLSTQCPTPN